MPTIYLRGANRTAQWYQDNYAGATFSRLDKFDLHTTETGGWPGYSAGASAPNATYYPKWRQIRQHFGINRSSRALRDPSSTLVRENRDNVFQLEIICYSDYRLAVERGGLWVGDLTITHMRDIAAMILQIHKDWGLPIQSSVTWREGRKTWYDDVRLTGPQFDAYRGILGHVHTSGNTHWDPGGFRYSKLEDALSYQLVNHPVYGNGIVIPPPSDGGGFDPEEDDLFTDEDRELLQRLNHVIASNSDTKVDRPDADGTAGMRYALQEVWEDTHSLGHVVRIAGELESLLQPTQSDGRFMRLLAAVGAIQLRVSELAGSADALDESALAREVAALLVPAVTVAVAEQTGMSTAQVQEAAEAGLRNVLRVGVGDAPA